MLPPVFCAGNTQWHQIRQERERRQFLDLSTSSVLQGGSALVKYSPTFLVVALNLSVVELEDLWQSAFSPG